MQASQTAHGNPWLLLSSVIFSSQLQMAIKPSHFHCSYNYCDCRDYNNRNNYNIISSGCNHYKHYKHCEYHLHITGRRSSDSFWFFYNHFLLYLLLQISCCTNTAATSTHLQHLLQQPLQTLRTLRILVIRTCDFYWVYYAILAAIFFCISNYSSQ